MVSVRAQAPAQEPQPQPQQSLPGTPLRKRAQSKPSSVSLGQQLAAQWALPADDKGRPGCLNMTATGLSVSGSECPLANQTVGYRGDALKNCKEKSVIDALASRLSSFYGSHPPIPMSGVASVEFGFLTETSKARIIATAASRSDFDNMVMSALFKEKKAQPNNEAKPAAEPPVAFGQKRERSSDLPAAPSAAADVDDASLWLYRREDGGVAASPVSLAQLRRSKSFLEGRGLFDSLRVWRVNDKENSSVLLSSLICVEPGVKHQKVANSAMESAVWCYRGKDRRIYGPFTAAALRSQEAGFRRLPPVRFDALRFWRTGQAEADGTLTSAFFSPPTA
jgi:hypothetical protein